MADKLTDEQKAMVKLTKQLIQKLTLRYVIIELKDIQNKTTVTNWYRRPMPLHYVFPLCKAARKKGYKVYPHHLRPDVFTGVEEFYKD